MGSPICPTVVLMQRYPEDGELFAAAMRPVLREAAGALCWLLSRGYAGASALRLVGDCPRSPDAG